jgi:hypothetical protein
MLTNKINKMNAAERMRLNQIEKTRKENAIMRKFSTTKGFYDEYFIKTTHRKKSRKPLIKSTKIIMVLFGHYQLLEHVKRMTN